jgi:hypothetical protein
MALKVMPDVEGPIRAWVRSLSLTDVDSRVFLGLPERCTFPAVEMTLIDGGFQTGLAPLADVVVSFNVWGGTRQQAASITWALGSAIESLASGTTFDSTLAGMGGSVVTGPLFRPDPDNRPRYLLDAAITVRPLT